MCTTFFFNLVILSCFTPKLLDKKLPSQLSLWYYLTFVRLRKKDDRRFAYNLQGIKMVRVETLKKNIVGFWVCLFIYFFNALDKLVKATIVLFSQIKILMFENSGNRVGVFFVSNLNR